MEPGRLPSIRLAISAVLGLGFFVIPVHVSGRWTVAFDIVVKGITTGYPTLVGLYCLVLVGVGAGASVWARNLHCPIACCPAASLPASCI